MENNNKYVEPGFSVVLCGILAVLFCTAPGVSVADVTVPAGEVWPIDYTIAGSLTVWGTANLLPPVLDPPKTGAVIDYFVNAKPGSTVNVRWAQVQWWIDVSLNANVIVYGTEFWVGDTQYYAGQEVHIPSGVLTVTYENGDTVDLPISCYADDNVQMKVKLAAPGGEPTPAPIDIDIKPGSYPNTINLGSNGVVPVAILSSASFDATQVDADTVDLAGAGVAVRGKGNNTLAHEEDVNADGLMDLVVQVETENLDPGTFQDGGAVLQVKDGETVLYEGWDEITIVPPE